MRLSELATDLDLEESGVWVPIAGDFEVKVVSISSKRGKAAYRQYLRPVERRVEIGAIGDDEAEKVVARYIARGLIVDWRGAENDSGEPITFSIEVAERELARPDLRHVREKIRQAAAEPELFKRELRRESAEALKADSAGS